MNERRPRPGAQPPHRVRLPAVQPAVDDVGLAQRRAAPGLRRGTAHRTRAPGRRRTGPGGPGRPRRPPARTSCPAVSSSVSRSPARWSTTRQLILADEPTGNLDSTATADVLDLFDELQAQGRTIVLITHEHDVAARAQRAGAHARRPAARGRPGGDAMTWAETLRTGWDAIRTRRMRSGLTVLGILIGIAAVILTVGARAGRPAAGGHPDRRARLEPAHRLPGLQHQPDRGAGRVRLGDHPHDRGCRDARRPRRRPGRARGRADVEHLDRVDRERDQLDHERRRHDPGLAAGAGPLGGIGPDASRRTS